MAKRTKRARSVVSAMPETLVLHGTVLPLDATYLHAASTAAVDAIYRESESPNTVRSYETALRYWAAWFQLRYRQTLGLPVSTPVVLQFLVDHVERAGDDGKLVHDLPAAIDDALVEAGFKAKLGAPKLSTLLHRTAVLSKAHQVKELANPVRSSEVQELIRRVRRSYAARGALSRSKPALTKAPLEALLATCGDDLTSVRDRALLLFAFSSGGRRRSEVTAAQMDQLERIDEHTYAYRLRRSKTNQEGRESVNEVKPIAGRAALALRNWLEKSRIADGCIFRQVRGSVVGTGLTPQSVRYIIGERAKKAGISDAGYSAHSLRSGFMTEAGRQQVPLGDAMALTDHRTVAIAMRYYQAGNVGHSPAVHLLDPLDNNMSGERR